MNIASSIYFPNYDESVINLEFSTDNILGEVWTMLPYR